MNVLRIELCTKLLQLLVFGLELFHHIGNDPFEFGTLEVTLLQLILQFLYQLTVELHAICNELDVFLNICCLVGAFIVLNETDAVLGLTDLIEAFLYLIQRSHHAVDLLFSICNNLLERVVLCHRLQAHRSLLTLHAPRHSGHQ